MQAWDQVKVKDGEHAGRAGLVIRVEGTGDSTVCVVNLDQAGEQKAETLNFSATELEFLGR